jgi:hypothetical protein
VGEVRWGEVCAWAVAVARKDIDRDIDTCGRERHRQKAASALALARTHIWYRYTAICVWRGRWV